MINFKSIIYYFINNKKVTSNEVTFKIYVYTDYTKPEVTCTANV